MKLKEQREIDYFDWSDYPAKTIIINPKRTKMFELNDIFPSMVRTDIILRSDHDFQNQNTKNKEV